MKFFLQILCVCLMLKLCLSESKCSSLMGGRKLLSEKELSVSDKYVKKYGKYIVYIWSEDVNHDDWGFWVGVILKDDIILTFYADYGEFKHIARVAAGAIKFNKRNFPNMIKFKDAVNMHEEMEDFPQLSLIRLDKKLTLNENVSILPLPTARHHKDAVCVTLSWGRYNQFKELMAHEVVIEDDCAESVICFQVRFDNEKLDPCATFTGGEPIFCSGSLIGIVGFNEVCDNNVTKASSVFDSLKWIEEKMDELNVDHLKLRSGCNTNLYKNSNIFIIHLYILIKILFA